MLRKNTFFIVVYDKEIINNLNWEIYPNKEKYNLPSCYLDEDYYKIDNRNKLESSIIKYNNNEKLLDSFYTFYILNKYNYTTFNPKVEEYNIENPSDLIYLTKYELNKENETFQSLYEKLEIKNHVNINPACCVWCVKTDKDYKELKKNFEKYKLLK